MNYFSTSSLSVDTATCIRFTCCRPQLMHLQELVTMKQKVALLQLNAEQMEGSLKYKLVTAEANTAAQQQVRPAAWVAEPWVL